MASVFAPRQGLRKRAPSRGQPLKKGTAEDLPIVHVRKKPQFTDLKTTKELIQGKTVTDEDWDTLITESCRIVDEDTKELIGVFEKRAIPKASRDLAHEVYHDIASKYNRPSISRATAAGKLSADKFNQIMPRKDGLTVVDFERINDFQGRPILSDGRVLRELQCNPVHSYRAGYAVHTRSNTAGPAGYTKDFPDEFERSIPFFQAIDDQFKRLLPDIHKLHEERVKLHPWTTIPGTGLSSIAINTNYQSAAHIDRGDFKDGYSVLTVVETPSYTGGYYCLLAYGLAVDIRDCDLLLSRSHTYWHANSSIFKKTKDAQRLSFVVYLSDRLADFGPDGQLVHRRTGSKDPNQLFNTKARRRNSRT